MKLVTTIHPRADGTVIVHGNDGNDYTFEVNEHGELACDVACDDTVTMLVNTGNFFPFDSDDYAAALRHLGGEGEGEGDNDNDNDNDGDGDEADGDGDGDGGDAGGLPLEAETPPKSFRKPRKAKAE